MSDALHRVSALVRLMVEQAAVVERAEEALARARAEFSRTEQEDLPELMREFGLSELKLEDGTSVSISEEVSAAITEANRAAAHAWLRAHEFGGLIKTIVSVEFGRGEDDEAAEAAERIASELHRPVDHVEKVHPSTLKSFVREQLAEGHTVPFDLFSVHPFARAKIKAPAPARGKSLKGGK